MGHRTAEPATQHRFGERESVRPLLFRPADHVLCVYTFHLLLDGFLILGHSVGAARGMQGREAPQA